MYRVDPVTGDILCETPEAAVALSQYVKRQNQSRKPHVAPTSSNGSRTLLSTNAEIRAAFQAHAFVAAVNESEAPIGGERLIGKIGCGSVQAMGAVVQHTTRILRESKYKLEDVVVRDRVGDDKVWKPGRAIAAGLNALKGNLDRLQPDDDLSDL